MTRREFYDQRALLRARETTRFYQQLLRSYYRFYVPAQQTVLEVGCGLGDLLAAVNPRHGIGIDFSPGMVGEAEKRHPQLQFRVADIATPVDPEERAGEANSSAPEGSVPFDYILLSDLLNDLPDVQAAFDALLEFATPRTRLVLNFFNNVWRPILQTAEKMDLKAPTMPQNWLSTDDVANLLHLAGWEVIKTEPRILWPARTPLLAGFLNRWMAPLFSPFCLTIFMIARPAPQPASGRHARSVKSTAGSGTASGPLTRGERETQRHYSCSVIVPARNEAGNIEEAVRRIPELGLGTEIVFVEGGSTDGTFEEIRRVVAANPERKIKIVKQQSSNKAGAVREGFAAATGDILLILDADLTMPPEELPKFYEVLRSGRAEFVNGVRLVYPMEDQAMQFLNMLANKLFSLAFSRLLGQKIKDTLCGTKALFRRDYEMIAQNRSYFGEFDPFGDFDLLFGAARLNLRIADLPIRYRARTYGKTNIHRWRHGWLLVRMVLFAARRLKFVRVP